MISDLQEAFEALQGKQRHVKKMYDYYDGNQPLMYTATRLREVFENRCARFSQNWCAVVVDSILDRLEITGWDAEDRARNAKLDELWSDLHIGIEADEVHEAMAVTGEGFIIVGTDEAGNPEVYQNHPANVFVRYQDSSPAKKKYAAKWYVDGDYTRIILYYEDRFENYFAKGKPEDIVSYTSFQFDETESGTNPTGIIPVFHFRNSRRGLKSELDNVIPIQDAINKLLGDMMVTAEFNAFPARYIITNANIDTLKNAPNEIWSIPAAIRADEQGTSVGTLEAADLSNYSNQISELANSIAVITRTPKHYFYGADGQPSGEALIAMEAPLSKKARKTQQLLDPIWSDVGAYLLLLSGFGDVRPQDITPVWAPVESIQPKTQAEIRTENIKSGLALSTALRFEGKSTDEIKQIMEEKAKEAEEQTALSDAILNSVMSRTAQENA
jgi:hypothetical protein